MTVCNSREDGARRGAGALPPMPASDLQRLLSVAATPSRHGFFPEAVILVPAPSDDPAAGFSGIADIGSALHRNAN